MNQAQEQFVGDFLLVAENQIEMYQEFKEIVKDKGVAEGAIKIQDEFETWISSLANQEEERGNESGALLLRQLLIGWGSDSFYRIAKRFQEEI